MAGSRQPELLQGKHEEMDLQDAGEMSIYSRLTKSRKRKKEVARDLLALFWGLSTSPRKATGEPLPEGM